MAPKRGPSLLAGAISIFILSLITAVRLCGDRLYDFAPNPEVTALPEDVSIICLAGGKKRVETALSLYAEGVGQNLVIIGAGPKSTVNGLIRAHAPEAAKRLSPERLARIHVETDSRNTIENAFAIDAYLHKNPKVKSILLVTSGYHMRRAQLLIELQTKRPVVIIPYTPPNEFIEQKNWWHTWLGIEVTTLEYLKLVLAKVLVPRLSFL